MSNQLLLRRRTMAAVKRPNYLKFTALEDGCTLALNKVSTPNHRPTEYSFNKGLFVPYVFGTVLTFNKGDTIEWRRMKGYESNAFSPHGYAYYNFVTSGTIYQDGMVTTLLRKDGNVQSIADYAFISLIKSAEGFVGSLNLPDSLVSIGLNAFAGCNGFSNQLVIPSSVTVIQDYAFQGCSSLTGDLTIPEGVITISHSTFRGCKGLNGNLTLPHTLLTFGPYCFSGCSNLNGYVEISEDATSIGNSVFDGCTHLRINDIISPKCYININTFKGWTQTQFDEGIMCVCKTMRIDEAGNFNFQKIIILEDLLNFRSGSTDYVLDELRIGGNFRGTYMGGVMFNIGSHIAKFFEIMGTMTDDDTKVIINGTVNIIHLGYNGIAGRLGLVPASKSGVIYVGDGSSDANDQAILDAYLADADWAQYSSKLAKWFDYHGQYRTYKVTDSLTNCTNSNPVVFPFITRGNPYECVISADDGYTLQSVTVTMMDTDNTSQTYGQQIDITSNVYDAATGTISIPSVTGNIEITANAN